MSFCTFYEIINTSKNSRMSQIAKKVWWIILKCRLLFYLTDTVSVTLGPSMVRCFGAMTLLTTTTCTISCRLLPLMTFDKTILFTIKEYRKVTAIKKKDWMLVVSVTGGCRLQFFNIGLFFSLFAVWIGDSCSYVTTLSVCIRGEITSILLVLLFCTRLSTYMPFIIILFSDTF